MKTIEVNNEKFIVMHECPAKKYAGVSAKDYLKLYNADATIKHKDILYFVKWAEPVKFEDIDETINLITSGSTTNGNDGN